MGILLLNLFLIGFLQKYVFNIGNYFCVNQVKDNDLTKL